MRQIRFDSWNKKAADAARKAKAKSRRIAKKRIEKQNKESVAGKQSDKPVYKPRKRKNGSE